MRFTALPVSVCFASVLMMCCVAPTPSTHAQIPLMFDHQAQDGPHIVYLLQGEKRHLSREFVAQLDGDALRISLETRGLVSTQPSDDLLVSLIQPSGERIDRRPDIDGQVLFEGVQQGLAALVVTADSMANTSVASLYAAVPFFVQASTVIDTPAEPFKLPLATIEPTSIAERIETDTSDFRDEAAVMEEGDFEVDESTPFRVQRLADGSVRGNILVPQRGYLSVPGVTRVTLEKPGGSMVTTYSDESGEFTAENVELGMHSMVATGKSGHAAYSVEVVEFQAAGVLEPPVTQHDNNTDPRQTFFVHAQQPAPSSVTIFLMPPALMDDFREIAEERLPGFDSGSSGDLAADVPGAGDPTSPSQGAMAGAFGMGGGGAGGFGGGGGGFGGGGGGFGGGGAGGLLGIAGLAVGITAIADDDDGFNAPVATPISPGNNAPAANPTPVNPPPPTPASPTDPPPPPPTDNPPGNRPPNGQPPVTN